MTNIQLLVAFVMVAIFAASFSKQIKPALFGIGSVVAVFTAIMFYFGLI